MEGLGRLFDISAGVVPVAIGAGATGKRVNLKDAGGVTVVIFAGAGTAGDDLSIDLQQHTASSGGTTADLDVCDHYYYKTGTTLAGTETWTKVTQTAASEVTDATGGAGTSAEQQNIVVIEVQSSSLSDGYKYFSVNIPDLGAGNDKVVGILYILRDLQVQRAPAKLRAPLR